MTTFLDGQQNLAALSVPGVYVDIIPPAPFVNGVPTNFEGLVGVADWGPVNSPVPFSTPDNCSTIFGTPQVRPRDLPSYVWAASQVGGNIAFYGVRVTDGTDVAASYIIATSCLTLTGRYSGSRGNKITAMLLAGSAPNTYSIVIGFPGRAPERFNNIAGTGNALWVAMAAAINNGNPTRGKSTIVIAAAGAGTTAPVLNTLYTLSGGTDGASGVTDATLMGVDTTPRTGMYALRGSGCDGFTLCDLADPTKYAAIDAFALGESMLAVFAGPSGETLAQSVAARVTAGLDDYFSWMLVGDYPTFYDNANGYSRLINPSAFALGLLGNLSSEQSPLNKQVRGISATQKSQTSQIYSAAELTIAEEGGVDLIVGPPTTPGGNYYTFITGRNTSSNTAARGIEWTRLTNFIARSIGRSAAGSMIGRLQSIRPDDRTRSDAKALLDGFFATLAAPSIGSNGNGMIDAWAVQCDLGNNPPNLQARGYLFAFAAVRYLNTVRYFVVKLAGGGNVEVTTQATPPSVSQFQ